MSFKGFLFQDEQSKLDEWQKKLHSKEDELAKRELSVDTFASSLAKKEIELQDWEKKLQQATSYYKSWREEIIKARNFIKEHEKLIAENAALKSTCNQRRGAYQSARIELAGYKEVVKQILNDDKYDKNSIKAVMKDAQEKERDRFAKLNATSKERAENKNVIPNATKSFNVPTE